MITKNIKRSNGYRDFKLILVSLFLISVMASGVYAAEITSAGDIQTSDTTPTITFTPVGNNSSYVCTLWIDNAARGVVTVDNNTLGSIICNITLAKGSYTYNISMYNSTEVPATTYSTDATIDITTFGSIVDMLQSLVGIFPPIVLIVIKIIPIFVAFAIMAFVITILTLLGKDITGRL